MYWYPWAPEDQHKWVRDLPEGAVTDLKGFHRGMGVPVAVLLTYPDFQGTIAHVRGIRADESLRRYRSVAAREKDNWINAPQHVYWSKAHRRWEAGSGGRHFMTSPIYDWTTIDVWTAPRIYGWDYNRAYDIMAMVGMTPHDQRVCPPYGEEPLRGLWIYAQCWPDLWHKMIERVPGAATAARYARSELYGFGDLKLPEGLTWREYVFQMLELYPPEYRAAISKSVRALMQEHKAKTRRPIHETQADPLTGISWKFIASIVSRGDMKGRRGRTMGSKATQARKKAGIESMDGLSDFDEGTRY